MGGEEYLFVASDLDSVEDRVEGKRALPCDLWLSPINSLVELLHQGNLPLVSTM